MSDALHPADDPAFPAGRRYTRSITVEDHHVDQLGHVDHAVYLNWVQDTVIAHWKRFAPAAAVRDHLWVALTHEITYRRPAPPCSTTPSWRKASLSDCSARAPSSRR